MLNDQPIGEIIYKRFSCRTYQDRPIEAGKRQQLEAFLANLQTGPLGTSARFLLLSATAEDRGALRGLGTYGFIKDAPGFILGAVRAGEKNLEDFGYLMEQAILAATGLDLGTCWLGGTFARSRFAEKAALQPGEVMPAVSAVGHAASRQRWLDAMIRRQAGSDGRRPWRQLFFDGAFGVPLSYEAAGAYGEPLEMARLGPSASNRQPWRIVREGAAWHFYLRRTAGYKGSTGLFVAADLQRVDMGIAMCHFALTAAERGLAGGWHVLEPAIGKPDQLIEYTVSWVQV